MKKFLALAAAVVLTLGTCTTSFAADGADILSQAKVHIDFEDSVADLNGNLEPVFVGESYTEGRFGKAGHVEGGQGHIEVPYLPGTDSFTITTWLYMEAWDGDPAIISNKDWDSGSNPGFVLMPKTDSFKLNANAVDANRFDSAWATERWIDDPTAMNQWVHVTFIVDRENNTFSYALNGGELVSKKMDYTTELHDTTNNYPICFGDDGPGKYNAGQIYVANYDEIAIFDRALTQEEVEAVYTYAPEGYEPAVLGAGKGAADDNAATDATTPSDDASEEGGNGVVVGVVVVVVVIAAVAVVLTKNKNKKK